MKTQLSLSLLSICLCLANISTAQTKTINGRNYKITFEKPAQWTQLSKDSYLYDEMYYEAVPNNEKRSEETYIKMLGNDFAVFQPLDIFIKELHDEMKQNHQVTKTQKLDLKQVNFAKNSYLTGNFKAYTYQLKSGRKYCILYIECKETIIEVAFSGSNESIFNKHYKAVEKLVRSLKVEARAGK